MSYGVKITLEKKKKYVRTFKNKACEHAKLVITTSGAGSRIIPLAALVSN